MFISFATSTARMFTFLAITPSVIAKIVYLSDAPMETFPNRIEYAITDQDEKYKLCSSVAIQTPEINPTSSLWESYSSLADAETIYVTVPLFRSPAYQVNATASVDLDAGELLKINQVVFGSLCHTHSVVSNAETLKYILENFYVPSAPFTLYINNEPVKNLCKLCSCKETRIGNFCALFDYHYTCFFSYFGLGKKPIEHPEMLNAFMTSMGIVDEAGVMDQDFFDQDDADDWVATNVPIEGLTDEDMEGDNDDDC